MQNNKLKEFFKPDRFKIIFTVVFIIITAAVFKIGDALNSSILEIVFVILYFPAAVFAWNFQFLPVFKHCTNYDPGTWDLSTTKEMCIYDQTVAVWLSIPVFIVYVYLLSCLINLFLGKLRRPTK